MCQYHAVMLDECGDEFGVTLQASSAGDARAQLREDYPESRCVQLENRRDTQRREQRMHAQLQWEIDNDMDAYW